MWHAPQTFFLRTPCSLLLCTKGPKLPTDLQYYYHRERSLRMKDLLGCTGSVPEHAHSESETNSRQSWENKFDSLDKIIPYASKFLLSNQNFCSYTNIILLILIFLNIENMQLFQLVRVFLFQTLPNIEYNNDKIFTCLPGRSPELW